MKSSSYLYDSFGSCEILINSGGSKSEMFIWGDPFLRNFYSIYDMEQNELGIAIDIMGSGKVSIEDAPTSTGTYLLIVGI